MWPPRHFTFKQGTDDNYSIIINAATLDGVALQPGDEIGVFTPAGLCAGAGVWTGAPPLAFSAWADDSQSPEIDGFRANETMRFRVWPASTNAVADYPAAATYTLGNGVYGNGVYARIANLTALTSVTQTIALVQRWNWISCQVQPEIADMAQVTAGMTKLVIMTNGAGKSYIPGVINNIGNLNVLDGYKVYLDGSDTLAVNGKPVAASTPIPLTARWNFVSYLPATTLTADQAFASIGGNLAIAKNDAGGFYIPGTINSMGVLTPNKGYRLYLNNPDTLIYPAGTTLQKAVTPTAIVAASRHFHPVAYTGDSYSVLINQIDGCSLQPGDEIGLFTENGICVGGAAWTGAGVIALSAWEDDPTTLVMDGYKPGDKMVFKIWQNKNQTELDVIAHFSQGDGAYASGEYAAIDLAIQTLPQGYALEQNYPNPFNPETSISFTLAENGPTQLLIYTLAGQEIRRLADENLPAGRHHRVWDGKDSQGITLPSGVYLYAVKSGSYSETRKMTLIK
jgi:hypothetical protein